MDFAGHQSLLGSHRAAERISPDHEFVQGFDVVAPRGRTNDAFTQTETRGKNPYLDSRTKRFLDLTVAAIALAVLFPLMLSIASAVLVTSRGPALFLQERGGRGQRPFRIMKFRSMYVQPAESSIVQATPGDPRATPLGRFLRSTSVDEIPQLFNVFKGEMSIVGPRPHAIVHDELFATRIDAYCNRFVCKPGITGLAQVRGYRGATTTQDLIAQRVALDLQYIETASLRLDLLIILRTTWTVLTCRNAH
ncbi:sugar transferase [uncultured Paracoccus sp.]|uniref:sugar transferase n=1 Tax=uncultured Paracoccus sp. TaxID=189685 RepID=UPI0026333D60|nr:sugar transferase [uncultured Paracoccus sp.]